MRLVPVRVSSVPCCAGHGHHFAHLLGLSWRRSSPWRCRQPRTPLRPCLPACPGWQRAVGLLSRLRLIRSTVCMPPPLLLPVECCCFAAAASAAGAEGCAAHAGAAGVASYTRHDPRGVRAVPAQVERESVREGTVYLNLATMSRGNGSRKLVPRMSKSGKSQNRGGGEVGGGGARGGYIIICSKEGSPQMMTSCGT